MARFAALLVCCLCFAAGASASNPDKWMGTTGKDPIKLVPKQSITGFPRPWPFPPAVIQQTPKLPDSPYNQNPMQPIPSTGSPQ